MFNFSYSQLLIGQRRKRGKLVILQLNIKNKQTNERRKKLRHKQKEQLGQAMREQQYQTKSPNENNYKSEIKYQTNRAYLKAQREPAKRVRTSGAFKGATKKTLVSPRCFCQLPVQGIQAKQKAAFWSFYQSHLDGKTKIGILYCQGSQGLRIPEQKEVQKASSSFCSIFALQECAEL